MPRLTPVGQVSVADCEDMAKQLKTPFIECSAKNRMNVDPAFHELVRLIRRFQVQSLSCNDMSVMESVTFFLTGYGMVRLLTEI